MEQVIEDLPEVFEGKGEVKGYTFIRKFTNNKGYVYSVVDAETNNIHYEVFKRQLTPICIDFANNIYSETEFKVKYPKSNSFGIWAWSYKNLNTALIKLDNIFDNNN